MRIKGTFAKQRKTEIKDYIPKYFIVSEGSCSEPRYFEGLQNSLLTENISIINIFRDFAAKTNSHPNFSVDIIREILINNEDRITLKEIKNKISNCAREHSHSIDMDAINAKIKEVYGHNDNYYIEHDKLADLFLIIFKDILYIDLALKFIDYFDKQNVTYSKESDKLNIVADRDKENFTEKQYDKVKQFCNDNDVNLCISNPNFEFWLMLHFAEVDTEDKGKMFKNEKVNNNRRYLEKRLKELCGYNKKNKLLFSKFEDKIQDAINREKNYSENIDELKDNLGSNIGILVQDMLNNSKKFN